MSWCQWQGQPVQRDRREQQALQEPWDRREQQVRQDLQEPWEIPVLPGRKDRLEQKALQALQEQRVRQGLRELVLPERQDLQAQKGRREQKALQDLQEQLPRQNKHNKKRNHFASERIYYDKTIKRKLGRSCQIVKIIIEIIGKILSAAVYAAVIWDLAVFLA